MSPVAISTATLTVIGFLIVLNLFALVWGLSFLRASKQAKRAAEGMPEPPPPVKAMNRRDFFRKSLITSVLIFGAEFGLGTIAFLWPNLRGGFGSKINAGSVADIKDQLSAGSPVYNGAGRFYLVPWDGTPTPEADYPSQGVTADGIMPLYQRCVHLGCRVPFCNSSKWFECPCHGSKYNLAGEYRLGPAPRGLDRFQMTIEGDQVIVDTSEIVLGPPRGADTIDQPPQGAFCVATG
jgi:cytochrome b6-f complex iron-sulfur subunit